MAANVLELTAEIVIAHASVTEMSSDDLLKEIKTVYATLQALEKGEKPVTIETPTKVEEKPAAPPAIQETKKRGRKPKALQISAIEKTEPISEKIEEKPATPPAPVLTIEEAFKPDQVACMICGKTGMKTLKRHLGTAHNMKPGPYRKQFNIPKDQPLAATAYVEKRRQAALDRGLGDKLVAARAARKTKKTAQEQTGE